MGNENYDKIMENIIAGYEGRQINVLLHSCCAPCSSACIERLADRCSVTVFYYNPNIGETDEYQKRKSEQIRLIDTFNKEERFAFKIGIMDADHDPESFYSIAKGLEKCPERGERCHKCYELRMRKTAEKALLSGGFDLFATTLTLSPLKDSDAINRIGLMLEKETGQKYLPSDFKKRNGYLRSIELSKQYGLYRQNYCGCVYSRVL